MTPTIQRIDEQVCREHWQALLSLALAKGCALHDACDAVQELFTRLLQSGEYETLGGWQPAQQRVWLRQKMQWHLVNRHRDSQRKARGGGAVHVSLEDAEHVAGGDAPDQLYDRALLRAALRRAGATEALLPAPGASSVERVRLFRQRKALRKQFTPFLQ